MHDWLVLEDVCFRYGGKRILEEVSLALPASSRVLAVIGRSGIGKSTLIGLLAGHVRPDRGTITICGKRVTMPGPDRPVVFQDHNLFPWMTTLENVVFGLMCRGMKPADRDRVGREWLAVVGLSGLEHEFPPTLSGGMRQRVALARAMALDPACLLLDEPFQGLDSETCAGLRSKFRELIATRSVRAVITTHDLADAAAIADHTLVLKGPGDCALTPNLP